MCVSRHTVLCYTGWVLLQGHLLKAVTGDSRKEFVIPDCHLTESGRHARNETCLMPFNQATTFFPCLVAVRVARVARVARAAVQVLRVAVLDARVVPAY